MTRPDPAASADALANTVTHNPNKRAEHGEASRTPPEGHHVPATPAATAGTRSENQASPKTGVPPAPGVNPNDGSLQRVRADASGQRLTTNQGVPVADNQNSLKSSLRGPTLMEDFILREKITHFDHERIPERIVHARGSAAHGYFEAYEDLSSLTRAAPFAQAGKRTPVFVRFSTVAGERGSADTVRDVRGFAVKFYTDEGNWDLVGNNIPVFFIQDAMKFPDLVHAVKPEPHNGMPQAASAHDTFWDFASLMPESMHMLMWAMSDRAIPRSLRMMQGFGVHTFRLVNADGDSVFVKFHWLPLAGTHSLVWDEALKVTGADPDFHRRDLWEAIEAGNGPQWELALQTFTEEQAAQFPFDVLDATKLVPEELAPLKIVGRMTLNRNPDNFFAETEQVAFCAAHIIPGIDFTNDPLLQGRIHSYVDTQISRLGGPNFHEIPINAPICPMHNNQRDGMHRQTINRGKVAYEPNSLGGGCPHQAGMAGFTSLRTQEAPEDKVRGKPELFADHYSQARLFWQSQTRHEQQHIINGFRFELSKVTVPAIRVRTLSMLANVDDALVSAVAAGLGLPVPAPQPLATSQPIPSYPPSPALSLMARPGQQGIATRQVAILVADGVDGDGVRTIQAALEADGAVPHIVGPWLGLVVAADGAPIAVERTLENAPGVLFDAVAIPCGEQAAQTLSSLAHALDFVRLQYRHCKPILAVGKGTLLLAKAQIPAQLPDGSPDPGLIGTEPADLPDALTAFKHALAEGRAWVRESDPPAV
ncbi:catalase [Duganella sp. FT92W]|uniref:Catalase n=1 Tax=Pseudoduganella rivuli TaxID=2666085 RepID=A0A7X2IKK7_9BURK|nr:catalase [Pseudoduganella rivuli]MRV71183.1 catalase [Pseudoduganella rivuli]